MVAKLARLTHKIGLTCT